MLGRQPQPLPTCQKGQGEISGGCRSQCPARRHVASQRPAQAHRSSSMPPPELTHSHVEAAAKQPLSGTQIAEEHTYFGSKAALPSKLQPEVMKRRIMIADSLWGLRSACRHVGYAFDVECLRAALWQLHRLYKPEQQHQEQELPRDGHHGGRTHSRDGGSTSPTQSNSSGGGVGAAAATLPSSLALMADTLDCLMHRLACMGGVDTLDPMGVATVAAVLGHLLPAIPTQQPLPRLAPLPAPPQQPHSATIASCPLCVPQYRHSTRARLSLASQLALSAEPRLHAFNARQLAMLLGGLARLQFRPSHAWRAAFYAASAAQLRATAMRAIASTPAAAPPPPPLPPPPGGQPQAGTPLLGAQHARLQHLPGGHQLKGAWVWAPGAEGLSGREAWALPGALSSQPSSKQAEMAAVCGSAATGASPNGDGGGGSTDGGGGGGTAPGKGKGGGVSSSGKSSWDGRQWRTASSPMSSLCTMLWALAHLHCPPPPAWLHASLPQFAPYLPHALPYELSMLTWALGSLGYQAPPAFNASVLHATTAFMQQQQQQGGQGAAAWQPAPPPAPPQPPKGTAARVPVPSSPPASHASPPPAAPGPAACHWSAPSRVNLLWGLAQQRVQLPVAWMERFLGALLQGNALRSLDSKEATMLVHALAKLKVHARDGRRRRLRRGWRHDQPPPPPEPPPPAVTRRAPQQQGRLLEGAEITQHSGSLLLGPKQQHGAPAPAANTVPALQPQLPPEHQKGVLTRAPAQSAALSAACFGPPADQLRPSPPLPPPPPVLRPGTRPDTWPSSPQPASTRQVRTLPLPTSPLGPHASHAAQAQPALAAAAAAAAKEPSLGLRPQPPTPPARPLLVWSQLHAAGNAEAPQPTPAYLSPPSLPCRDAPPGLPSQRHPDPGPVNQEQAHQPQQQQQQQQQPQPVWQVAQSPTGRRLQGAVLGQCIIQVYKQLPQASTHTLVTLLWSLAKLGLRPHPALLERAMAVLAQRWQAQDAWLLHSRSRAATAAEDEVPLWAAELPQGHAQVSAWDVCMLAYALARLKVKPCPEWLHSLMDTARSHFQATSTTQLVSLTWALMVMRARPGMQWLLQLWGALDARREQLGGKERRQLAMAWVLLPGSHARRVILAQHFPKLLAHILHVSAHPPGAVGRGTAVAQSAASGEDAPDTSTSPAAGSAVHGRNGALWLSPSFSRVLTRTLKEGIALRSTRLAKLVARSGSAGMRACGVGTGAEQEQEQQQQQPQHKQRIRLSMRMQRVSLMRLAMLTHRQSKRKGQKRNTGQKG